MPIQSPPTVTPRLAATTLIVRDGATGMEVLMVRRSMQASFMPGAFVFPGGAVDAADGDDHHLAACDEPAARLAQRIGAVTGVGALGAAFAVAALRECFEECGLWLGAPDHHVPTTGWAPPRSRLHAGTSLATLAAELGLPLATSGLQPWSRWVTPVGLPKRFDTVFLVSRAPAGQEPEVDAGETTTLAVNTVQSLGLFSSAAALLAHAAAQPVLAAIHPRVVLGEDGKIKRVLLPDQPGYDQAWAG